MKKHIEKIKQTIKEDPELSYRLLLDVWNAERPHFGNDAPHRYHDNDKTCKYCGRPINWKPINIFDWEV